MENTWNRDEITEKVILLFVDTVGFIERGQVTEHSDFIHDFNVIDDDLSCFVRQVEWQFKLHSSQQDWDTITTIRQIVDLIRRST